MKEIPELEDVKKSIENFKNGTFLKIDDFENIDDYLEYFDEIFKSHFFSFHYMLQFQSPLNFNFKLFRVREFSQIKNKNLFCEYSYPPPFYTTNGRCNFRNHPIFYCSNNPITALLEVVRNTDYKSKKFCISTWSLINNNKDFIMGSFLQSKLHPLNLFQQFADNLIDKIDETFEHQLTESQKLGIIEFYNFLDSKFIEDTDYSISAYLSHKKLYANHNYASDMVIYPSVQTEAKSVNFAIHPNFVDNCMNIERFYIVELNDYNSETNKFSITFSKYGKIEKNVILWKNIQPKDIEYEENFKTDFKAYLGDFKNFNYEKNKH